MPNEPRLAQILEGLRARKGRVVVLTGAGISAESGIPTFRGQEGIWVVGSRNHMPQEMATREMFDRAPEEVWRWYLYRFGVCRHAQPNAGHRALVALEDHLGDRFTLVTQNIDGLHHRAGSRRVLCIHGDARWVRCAGGCGPSRGGGPDPEDTGLVELPDLGARGKDDPFTAADRERLTCPRCGSWLRPHVLWFDETYDEEHYRADSAIAAAAAADLLLVVGTSGATNLPIQIGRLALAKGAAVVDVDPDENPFADLARRVPEGFFARGPAAERLPEIVRALAPRRD